MDERVVQSSHKIVGFLVADQCDQIRCSFTDNNLTVVGKILSVYSVFGKILIIHWQQIFANGQIFFFENGQNLKNNLRIRSHCLRDKKNNSDSISSYLALSLSLAPKRPQKMFQ